MQKLIEVEEAKALLTEAKDWSIWHWLLEKKRVRSVADRGTAALDELEKKVKATWNADLRKAYRELDTSGSHPRKAKEESKPIDPVIKAAARRVKDADVEAYEARMDAEATFDVAEKRLSASMARGGAEKAILAYDLREKSIRKAEAANRVKAGAAGQES